MREYLDKLPKDIRELIHLTREISHQLNYHTYLVGGFVRDLILGVRNLDLDIVVEGDGIIFATELAKKLSFHLIRHRRFGTATVIVPTKFKPLDKKFRTKNSYLTSFKIDIATAREEFYKKPASLPIVSPGTIKDDLRRRDFTINAMAISVSEDNFGRLIDFFKGRDDIRQKKIRVLHNLSFIDDPTRILRAIRFEQRYGFYIEPHTLRLLKDATSLKMLEKVNPHRLRDEMILILKEPYPIKYIKRINNLAGLSFISPNLHFSRRTISFLRSIDRQILWFKNKTPRRRLLDTWLMYLIGLIADMEMNYIKEFCEKFAFSRGEIKRIFSFKKTIKRIAGRLKQKLNPSQIYRCLEPLSYEVILLLKAKFKDKVIRKNIEDFFIIYNSLRIQATGADLARLEIAPGPHYKSILRKTLYAKLDKRIDTKEEELEFIKNLIKKS